MLDWSACPRNVLPWGEGLTIEQLGTPSLGVQLVVDPISGDLILTPVEAQEAPEAGTEAPPVDREALAIGVLVKTPGWTVQQIADRVGVHRGSLYRYPTFLACWDWFRAAGKQEFLAGLPRGTKEFDPDDPRAGAQLEAWRERHEEEYKQREQEDGT